MEVLVGSPLTITTMALHEGSVRYPPSPAQLAVYDGASKSVLRDAAVARVRYLERRVLEVPKEMARLAEELHDAEDELKSLRAAFDIAPAPEWEADREWVETANPGVYARHIPAEQMAGTVVPGDRNA